MQKYFILMIGILLTIGVTGSTPARDLPETMNREYRIEGDHLNVDIQIDGGEFTLSRSADVRMVRVRIDYNPNRCKIDVEYDPGDAEFRLTIDHRQLFRRGGDDVAKIRVELPAEPVTELAAHITAGEMDFILGDMTLQNCRIKSTAGELTVDFDQPNRIRMERLAINCSIGETQLRNLGNARFEKAIINSGIGELSLDFYGWRDSHGQAQIDLDLGETTIYVPREAVSRMKVKKAGFLTEFTCSSWFEQRDGSYYSQNYSGGNETLDLLISSGIGELEVLTN